MIVTRKQACEFITESLNNEIDLTGERLEAVILAVNSDLQVRDWLVGLPNRWSIDEGIKFMQYMCIHAPAEDLVPFVTVQAMYHYEQGDTEKAIMLTNYALRLDKEYSLAKLLRRIIAAGWPAATFQEMRNELDVKVVEECYGELGSTTITENGEVHVNI
jgi:Domain of unknown function (DUF4192)